MINWVGTDNNGSDMFSFKPSTTRLFAALNFDWPEPENEEQAEDAYPVHCALTDWTNRLYSELSQEQYENGTWPASQELHKALRDVLADLRNHDVAQELAYSLVRCGFLDEEVLSALCPWDAMLFRWKAAGFSIGDIFAKFKAAGVAGSPTVEDLEKVECYLENPVAHISRNASSHLLHTILKGRTFICSLYANGEYPHYTSLFENIALHANPPLAVTQVKLIPLEDELIDVTSKIHLDMAGQIPDALESLQIFEQPETFWKLSFEISSVEKVFYIPGDFCWLKDIALAKQCDRLLANLGRTDRVLRFGISRVDCGSFWGRYTVADPFAFSTVCQELGIPLADFTGSHLHPAIKA